MDGEEDDVMYYEVPEDVDDTLPPPEPKPEPKPEPRIEPAPRPEPRLPRSAEILRQQLAASHQRNAELVTSLQESAVRAHGEVARQRQENAELKRNTVEERRLNLESAIATIDAALEEAEASYAKAFNDTDGLAAAKAQRRMGELTARKVEMERSRAELPTKEVLEQQVKQAAEPRTQDERIEVYLQQFQPKTQQWLRQHPEFITNRVKNQSVLDAHKAAVTKELEPESDEYFDFINQRVGVDDTPRDYNIMRQNGDGGRPMKRAQTPVRASAPVRSGSNGVGISVQGMRRVSLTVGEREHATDGTIVWPDRHPQAGEPIGINEMVRRKALIEAGKAGKLRYVTGDA
jgi:hypothetical protein